MKDILRTLYVHARCTMHTGVVTYTKSARIHRMADKDRKDPLDLHKAERMLRKAAEIVMFANMTHPRAFSKLGLFIDEVLLL